jgi:TonB family protein
MKAKQKFYQFIILNILLSQIYLLVAGQKVPKDSVNIVVDLMGIPSSDVKKQIYSLCEIMPIFPNGNDRLGEYLKKSTMYPKSLLYTKAKETIIVKFTVEINGQLTNIEVLNKSDSAFEAEAIRVIKCMPDWIPGSQDGVKVRVYQMLPIRFCIENCAGW